MSRVIEVDLPKCPTCGYRDGKLYEPISEKTLCHECHPNSQHRKIKLRKLIKLAWRQMNYIYKQHNLFMKYLTNEEFYREQVVTQRIVQIGEWKNKFLRMQNRLRSKDKGYKIHLNLNQNIVNCQDMGF
eukprot:403354294